jgi:hypothetical protein
MVGWLGLTFEGVMEWGRKGLVEKVIMGGGSIEWRIA